MHRTTSDGPTKTDGETYAPLCELCKDAVGVVSLSQMSCLLFLAASCC
jgi:hypothetical protein